MFSRKVPPSYNYQGSECFSRGVPSRHSEADIGFLPFLKKNAEPGVIAVCFKEGHLDAGLRYRLISKGISSR